MTASGFLPEGSFVALPTPFRAGRIDAPAFDAMVERLAAGACEGVVVCGTTGEAPTLNPEERKELIKRAVRVAHGRVPVIAGVGTQDTRTTIDRSLDAQQAGTSALLVVTPPYNRPSQRGLELHFGAVAQAVELPIILYNVPSRTAVDLLPVTAARIACAHANVVAVKEALPEVARMREYAALGTVPVLCGSDECIVDFLMHGATGVIGVISNLLPLEVQELIRCVRSGSDEVRAAAIQEELLPLARALALDTNPVPLKAALAHLGLCRSEVRLPLTELGVEAHEQLLRILPGFALRG